MDPKHHFPFCFFFSFFVLFFLSNTAHANPAKNPDFRLSSCLNSSNVRNFTVVSSPEYDTLLNFSIQNLRFAAQLVVKPLAIILPDSKDQLRAAILCCRNTSLTIRLRSGGHSYEGQSYVAGPNEPFVVIDLINLNRVRVELQSKTAWVESGATLGEIYYEVASTSSSLAFSAGSCPTVGSGGHISGGGYGLLSRKYGLAADNVIDAILIDSNGRVLDRNLMGEDVFWAIRGGGGGSWGAVYAWLIRLSPVPNPVTACVASRPGSVRHVAGLVHKWQLLGPNLPDELYLSAYLAAGSRESGLAGVSVSFNGLYLGPKSKALAILNRSFPELGLTEPECKEMSWIESAVVFSGLPNGSLVAALADRFLHDKSFFKAKSDYVRASISEQNLTKVLERISTVPHLSVIMDPYGGAMSRIARDHLPFPHRDGNLYSIQYMISSKVHQDWSGKYNYVQRLRGLYDFMGPFVSNGPRAAYVNYLDLDLGSNLGTSRARESRGFKYRVDAARVWGEKYFSSNLDRLVRAKTIIDPDNVFRNSQSIPPLNC